MKRIELIIILILAAFMTGCSSTAEVKSYDHLNSPYYRHPDFYQMESTETLTILTGFSTYQQTTEYTCGPASMLMVLNWYGDYTMTEMEIAEAVGSRELIGTVAEDISEFFRVKGWTVEDRSGKELLTDEEFPAFVLGSLKQGTPIIVDWVEWGGHYVVIIGYDTMGTAEMTDDVLILADPYDTGDHLQDGYYIFPAEMFFYMWKEGYGHDGKEAQSQLYVIAHP